MIKQPATVINEILECIQEFFVKFGWPIVICVIVIYLSRDYIKQYKQELSLKRAQNPHRVQILDEERKRVRLKQQLEANKALLEQKEKEKDEPPAPKPKKAKLPKPPSAPSGGYNPLLGGGSNVQTFKPSGGGMRNAGRRRG